MDHTVALYSNDSEKGQKGRSNLKKRLSASIASRKVTLSRIVGLQEAEKRVKAITRREKGKLRQNKGQELRKKMTKKKRGSIKKGEGS